MKNKISNLIGEFYWGFEQTYFIETTEGNFIWSSPDYNGDGTIKKYNGRYKDWCEQYNVICGRNKGIHRIGDYCGENFVYMDDINRRISNVKATIEIEGFKFTEEMADRAKRFLSGEISSEEALKEIKESIDKKVNKSG